jgi:hypothetical protein
VMFPMGRAVAKRSFVPNAAKVQFEPIVLKKNWLAPPLKTAIHSIL